MRCTTPMLARLDSVLERAGQSTAKMVVYLRNIWFAVAKDNEKMSHHKRTLQGQVVMLVFNLVSARRGFGQCKRSYKSTIIILLVQISHTS